MATYDYILIGHTCLWIYHLHLELQLKTPLILHLTYKMYPSFFFNKRYTLVL